MDVKEIIHELERMIPEERDRVTLISLITNYGFCLCLDKHKLRDPNILKYIEDDIINGGVSS